MITGRELSNLNSIISEFTDRYRVIAHNGNLALCDSSFDPNEIEIEFEFFKSQFFCILQSKFQNKIWL